MRSKEKRRRVGIDIGTDQPKSSLARKQPSLFFPRARMFCILSSASRSWPPPWAGDTPKHSRAISRRATHTPGPSMTVAVHRSSTRGAFGGAMVTWPHTL